MNPDFRSSRSRRLERIARTPRGLCAVFSLALLLTPSPFRLHADPPQEQAPRKYRILFVTSEVRGELKTGGLGDYAADFTKNLMLRGHDVTRVMPDYASLSDESKKAQVSENRAIQVGMETGQDGVPRKISGFSLKSSNRDGVKTFFLHHDAPAGQRNYFDNLAAEAKPYAHPEVKKEAMAAFGRAVSQLAIEGGYDFVYINDWPAGMVAPTIRDARMYGRKTPKMIGVIHNLAYQEQFPAQETGKLGLHPRHFNPEGMEFYGNGNFMKGTLGLTDGVMVVSNQYAREITTPLFGAGLEGLAAKRANAGELVGVLNGIDPANWNPATHYHPVIGDTFTADDLSGKEKGKRKLLQFMADELRKRHPEMALGPLTEKSAIIAMTSRLSEQKGPDYVIPAMRKVLEKRDVRFLIAGDGDPKFVQMLAQLEKDFPGKLLHLPFSEAIEKRALAYSDLFINFPRWEPSGLNQMYAQANGTPPIVSGVGGLVDSVEDGKTGFIGDLIYQADGKTVDLDKTIGSVERTLDRGLDVYEKDPTRFHRIQAAAMRLDHSWANRIKQYEAFMDYLYEGGPQILAKHAPGARLAGLRPSELRDQAREVARHAGITIPKLNIRCVTDEMGISLGLQPAR